MSRLRVNSISTFTGDRIEMTGSLVVTGNVRAEQFIATTVTSSIVYQSGSTEFGDTADDTHVFTGKLSVSNGITGSTDFDTLVNKPTLLSGSNQIASDISGSFTLVSSSFASTITDIIDGTVTVTSASYAVSSSHEITYELSSSHAETADQVDFTGIQNKPTLISSSVQIASDISGSITEFSSSISTRVSTNESNITALQSFSSSLDATYATDIDLNLVSSSVDSLNAASSSYLTSLPADLVSGSNQLASDISGSFTSISSSLVTRIEAQENFSSSIDASFATDADLNLVSSSVDALNAATSSYAVSSSVSLTYLSIADLKTLVASSATYNEFTASIAAL